MTHGGKMKRLILTVAVLLAITAPLSAQKLSGGHYNLNIIGVDNPKNSTLTTSNRHTIFVGLGRRNAAVTTNIWLTPGFDFKVCDGNGFDAAYDCSGAQIKNLGATFQLPCNTYNTYDPLLGCPTDVAQRSYVVYARALGKPGGQADVMTCATETTDFDGDGTLDLLCSTENVLTLKRGTGKSIWQDATSELTSLVADIDGDGDLETVALFADGFEDFFWEYANQGLRLAQVRFYPVSQ
jgi:hypothetical protein